MNFTASFCYGGLYSPPLKTRFWESPGHPDHVQAESRKKVRPPADGPAGGFPHFFSDFGDNRIWLPGTLLKKWSKQGVNPPPPNKSNTLIEATLRIREYTSNIFFDKGNPQIKATLSRRFFLDLIKATILSQIYRKQ